MFILTEKNQAEAVRQALRQRLEGWYYDDE